MDTVYAFVCLCLCVCARVRVRACACVCTSDSSSWPLLYLFWAPVAQLSLVSRTPLSFTLPPAPNTHYRETLVFPRSKSALFHIPARAKACYTQHMAAWQLCLFLHDFQAHWALVLCVCVCVCVHTCVCVYVSFVCVVVCVCVCV